MAFRCCVREGSSWFFTWAQWEKTDHSQQCWNLGSSLADAGLSTSCSSESRACQHSGLPYSFIHLFLLCKCILSFYLGPGFLPGSVRDAGERMMNKISMVHTLMKLTIRGWRKHYKCDDCSGVPRTVGPWSRGWPGKIFLKRLCLS